MISRAERLARLAAAQGELARHLEAKLLHSERECAALILSVEELHGAVEGAGRSGLPFTGAGLRRILDMQRQIAGLKSNAAKLRGQFIAARAREKALSEKARAARLAFARKALEEEILETALAMRATASRKPGVVS